MVKRREKTGHPDGPYEDWVPLSEAIYSLEHLKSQLIHPDQAAQFRKNGDGVTTEFAGSVERFLAAMVEHAQKEVVDMLVRVSPILADWNQRSDPLPRPVVGEDDHLIPPGPPLLTAWSEAEGWFEGICRYGWVDDPKKRPAETDKGYPRWLFWACIELALEFLKTEPTDPADLLLATFFLQERGWAGWERVIPKVPQEQVTIQFRPMEFVREENEPRSFFVQRVLGWVANDVMEQVNAEASGPEWLAKWGCVPRPLRPEVIRGRKPSKTAEAYLVKRMLGRGVRTVRAKKGGRHSDATIGEQTRRILLLLGFVRHESWSAAHHPLIKAFGMEEEAEKP